MLDQHQTEEEWEGRHLEYDLEAEATWGNVDVLSQVSGLGVRMVLCQKVMAWETRRALEAAGIQVIDRLGTAGTARVLRLSKARPISSANHRVTEADLGTLDIITNVTAAGRQYIQLNTAASTQVTILLGSLGEQQAEEVETVIKRSLESLSDLVTQSVPSVLPGGGCLESALSLQTDSRQLMRNLIKTALVPGKLQISEAFVEMEFGHLFANQNSVECQCGMVELSDVCQDNFVPALEIYSSFSPPNRTLKKIESLPGGKTLLLDSFSFKRSALLTAVESSGHLSNIGTMISY